MDIMLERMLSLVPRKPDGKFVHGALKEFATSLGLKSGNLISDWMSGKSSSYKNYLYQVAAIYDVSVEWLRGETDDKDAKKSPTVAGEGMSELDKELYSIWETADDDERRLLLDMAKMLKNRRNPN